MSKKKVYVVPHSHWDREWYFTIEDSNVLLSENIPYLMDVLERDNDFKSYVFDGQLSVVEEFLKVCPEERERLKNHISQGRILVGPWYTQTDSLLVNKESIIRNLLYGTRIGEEMGNTMKVGYLPDIFGENMYLPSIFKGFKIDYTVFQRGVYTDSLNENLNFIWQSPDGIETKANNIFLGYGPGKFISSDDEYIKDKLMPMLEKLSSLNKSTDNILLPSGGDQVLVNKKLPKIIKELNEKIHHYEFILSDYESFMEETWKNNKFENEISGELIACEKSRIHNTIGSQRYDIKRLNTLVENKILYVLEPLAVIGKDHGLKYPQKWIDIMWKLMFDVHAHDSIGGCNSDDTNRDIINRLIKVERIADNLINLIKKKITYSIEHKIGKENILVVFNLKANNKCQNIESVIFTRKNKFEITTLNHDKVQFDVVEQEYLSGGKKVVVTAEGEKEVELEGYYKTKINFFLDKVPSLGYTTLEIKEKETKMDILEVSKEKFIENNKYKITFEDGELKLENKENNKIIHNLICFEDLGDAGDSYDFSPLKGDTPILSKTSSIISIKKGEKVQKMVIKNEFKLPRNLNSRQLKEIKDTFEILTYIKLIEKEDFVRVKHHIKNNVKDHRVRVLFNTSMENLTHSYADEGFSIIKRDNKNRYMKNWREKDFKEAPVSIYVLENFAALCDGNTTFSAITKGIKEYEVLDGKILALTLFRAVGVLGKDNLQWRPGRASGINNKVVHTPDAEMLKDLTFEYAIYFKEEKICPINLFRIADNFIEHFESYQRQKLNTFEERLERFEIPLDCINGGESYSMFSIDNNNVFVSAIKDSCEKDGIIVRVFNPDDEVQSFSIISEKFKKVILCNLHEDEEKVLEEKIKVRPKGYVTLKLKS
ncbi:glycoside hydrolase family 38 C-terminal domain-containing protein [Clostridium sp. Marseille-Q2269]|uniref:glycoside hydrolase family 38 N-terminal domain-containing protein n=1 Tax=Clostridium sp. Marseille-Q2269 TaxID=2942205 RepID=UPI0020735467|nr:glycoside hydrolase family 38 C-terminal domain-containing protein [Clostridium sp. Marseille-Q2269]